ncbi:MAG: methyltransferase domain-containing protein [Thermoanaerobaculia bacterium]|nr:methyltransferase domain-containing protein [Thermoanaerobaculia bacterium]MCZ7650152.1 methyltransferase domain-containing protein [Thermoanaerobaculia bacterium]
MSEPEPPRAPAGGLSPELGARLAALRWTAHNLPLPGGRWTLPGQPEFLAASGGLAAIRRLAFAIYGPRLDGLRVLDLGCLEGGYAFALARDGAEVVGIDARAENIAKCELVRDAWGLAHLSFRQGDVKEVARGTHGEFDLVLALGILYHLDEPARWLAGIGALTRGVLCVDTHFAPDDDADLALLRPDLRKLGPIERTLAPIEADGLALEGRWFDEWTTAAERDAMPWASWSNPRSFWLTRASLGRAVRAAGFETVAELLDFSLDRYELLQTAYPRLLLAGFKSAALASRFS